MYAPTPEPVTPWTWSSMKRIYERYSVRTTLTKAFNHKCITDTGIELGPSLAIHQKDVGALDSTPTLNFRLWDATRKR